MSSRDSEVGSQYLDTFNSSNSHSRQKQRALFFELSRFRLIVPVAFGQSRTCTLRSAELCHFERPRWISKTRAWDEC